MPVPILAIVSHTPLWVFALFGFVAWRAGLQLRPRVVPVRGIWIMPAIFVGWGLLSLFEGRSGTMFAYWVAGMALGGAADLMVRPRLEADHRHKLVRRPGSAMPLLRILLIFGSHYALRVVAALHPFDAVYYLDGDRFVSGAAAGYFLGWGYRFWTAWRTAMQTDLRPPPPVSVQGQADMR